MNLIIVESPTKEKTIDKFLKRKNSEEEFIVKSSYGHVRDLPVNNLGIDEKNSFKPYYIILPKAKKILAELKKILPKIKEIYLATDFDREGEAIAWHITQLLGLDLDKVKRITFHEITEKAIFEALKNPRKIDLNLVNSQQARRIIDRIVGYKISPVLWEKIANKLSAGRVQSAALKFIYDREIEIEKFKPQEYWTIEGDFLYNEFLFKAKLSQIEDKQLEKLSIQTEQQAKEIAEEIKKEKTGEIFEVKIEAKTKQPPAPFITSTLQQEASKKLSFSPSKTMYIAQTLYEGVDIGENERVGLITYMRTDSTFVSDEAITELRKFISEKFGNNYLSDKIRKYKTKIKNAQEAHEAIRPTSVYRTPEEIKKYLTEDQYKLYKLIWERFVATQFKNLDYQVLNLKILVKQKYIFEAEQKNMIFEGYTLILKDDEIKDKNNVEIFKIKTKDEVTIKDCYYKKHLTEPPPRYTEASLIKELEKNGIGRPSTYATIVDTLKERKYVIVKKQKFYITQIGKQVIGLLSKYFPEIVDKNYTAKMESLLDKVALGKESWINAVTFFYNPLIKQLSIARNSLKDKEKVLTEKKCKLCGAHLILRTSRFGKFLSCENFPKCKYKVNKL